MSASATPPLAAPAEQTYRRARRRWQIALATPLVYLAVAFLVKARPDAGGGPGMDSPVWRGVMLGMTAGLALGLTAGRWRQRGNVARLSHDPDRALRRWMWDFYILASLADTFALLGLLDTAVSGRGWAIGAGGALAYLGYAVAFPRRQDLTRLNGPLTGEFG